MYFYLLSWESWWSWETLKRNKLIDTTAFLKTQFEELELKLFF